MLESKMSKINYKQNVFNQEKVKMDLSKEIDSIISRIKSRVEREIPDTGYFRDFGETLGKDKKPDFFASDFSLFIERDEERDGRAFLGVSVLHPTLSMDAASYLMNGDRKAILEYISNPDFKREVTDTIMGLSKTLENR